MNKEIVTTKTFKEIPMPWWTSEIDVYDLIYTLIKMTCAKNVMEIGVFEGYTSVKMVEALPKDGKFTGIDINDYLYINIKQKKAAKRLLLLIYLDYYIAKNTIVATKTTPITVE